MSQRTPRSGGLRHWRQAKPAAYEGPPPPPAAVRDALQRALDGRPYRLQLGWRVGDCPLPGHDGPSEFMVREDLSAFHCGSCGRGDGAELLRRLGQASP
jgi:hypothetical protein